MSKQILQSTKEDAFINATLAQTRLLSERVTSASSKANKEPKEIQIRVDTSSGFSVALDNVTKPNIIFVEIVYKVNLKAQDTDKQLIDYEAKHVALFNLVGWFGFNDWSDVPNSAMAPYLAMAQNIAIRRAEGTMDAMALRGISLPVTPVINSDISEIKSDTPGIKT
jgi:hypothetical protein